MAAGVLLGKVASPPSEQLSVTAVDPWVSLVGAQEPSSSNAVLNRQLPLVNESNLIYQGAFRVPISAEGEYGTLNYGGDAITFNPIANSLFIVCHRTGQLISEVSIPLAVKNSDLNHLATSKFLQRCTRIVDRIPNKGGINGDARIGGLQVANGKLIGTYWEYYDADNSQQASHFVLDRMALDRATVTGLFQVGKTNARAVAGYMAPVPLSWQQDLNAPYLTGLAGISIVSTSGFCPAAVGFDPAKLGVVTPVPAIAYLYCPKNNEYSDFNTANPYFNGVTSVRGAVFPRGTRTVLLFGTHTLAPPCYGESSSCKDPVGEFKGYHAVGGRYLYYVWAYDALDLVAVKNNRKSASNVKPYAVWSLNLPFATGTKEVGGIAYDASNSTMYLSAIAADRLAPYTSLPVIHVFRIEVH